MLAKRVPEPAETAAQQKNRSPIMCTETAKIIAKQPPLLPESPIRMVGMQQKMPEEIKTSKKFKSEMGLAF